VMGMVGQNLCWFGPKRDSFDLNIRCTCWTKIEFSNVLIG
jgi:hypothetical protein